jgi:DNA-binding NarL/FixJ family response regulator
LLKGLGCCWAPRTTWWSLAWPHHSRQAVDAVARYRPAVCILDAQLPDRDLAETLATVKAASPTTRLLALTDDANPQTTAAVLTAGADGWLAKNLSSPQVAATVRKLAAGEPAAVELELAVRAPGREPSVALLVGR